jgi:cell wall assembly regulator SMI1
MKELYLRLKTALKNIDESLPDILSPQGVSDAMITSLETKTNRKLPSDFLSFYRICDGQCPHDNYLVDSEEFLSFSRIQDEWSAWKDLFDDGTFIENEEALTSEAPTDIKSDWWNPAWIPFTYNGAGDHLCLDLDPAEDGSYGQVIRMWHDDAERTLEYSSFLEWLTNYVEDLEQGKYFFKDGFLELKEDASPLPKETVQRPGFLQRFFGSRVK